MRTQDLFYSTWTAMPAKTRLRLMPMITLLQAAETDEKRGAYKALILEQLTKKKKVFRSLSDGQVVDIYNDIDPLKNQPDLFLVESLRPTAFGKRYRGPMGVLLSQNTFLQFIDVDVNYIRYIISNKPIYLAKMINALYLKKGVVYSESLDISADKWLAFVEKPRNQNKVQAILFSYSSIRHQLMNMFKDFWPGSKDSKTEKKLVKSKPRDLHQTWHDCLVDLSKCPEYTGMEAAKAANLHEALYVLNKRAKENKKKQ